MYYSLLFHGIKDCTNAPQYYVTIHCIVFVVAILDCRYFVLPGVRPGLSSLFVSEIRSLSKRPIITHFVTHKQITASAIRSPTNQYR